jgi:hypothetical protein
MTINIEELKRDREAGTDGPWRTTGVMFPGGYKGDVFKATAKRIPDCHHVARCFAEKPEKSPACSLGAIAIEREVAPIIEANARRIARVPDLEAAFLEAVERQERQYHVGPLTFDRVFRAGQLENLYDMQAVLDAVERALEAE